MARRFLLLTSLLLVACDTPRTCSSWELPPLSCTPQGFAMQFYLPNAHNPSVTEDFGCQPEIDGNTARFVATGQTCVDTFPNPLDGDVESFSRLCKALPDGVWQVVGADGGTRDVTVADGGVDCGF